MIHRVIVKAVTWSRDANGLFDYECSTHIDKDLKAFGNGKLIDPK